LIAHQVLGKGDGERKPTRAFFTQYQQRMTQAVLFPQVDELLFDGRLTDDIAEKHAAK
jgi:hypothetical protein